VGLAKNFQEFRNHGRFAFVAPVTIREQEFIGRIEVASGDANLLPLPRPYEESVRRFSPGNDNSLAGGKFARQIAVGLL
jgi:hypothetical protein